MNDPLSPSRGFPPILAGIIGLFVGGAVAGAILGFLLVRQQARHTAELAAVTVPVREIENARNNFAVFDMTGKSDSDEKKITKFGTDFVEDLENNRLPSAYRAMSPEFQKKTQRAKFDEMIAAQPALRKIAQYDRVQKVRMLADGKWDFYFTGTERETNSQKVNVTLTLSKLEGNWRVDELEILADSKKP